MNLPRFAVRVSALVTITAVAVSAAAWLGAGHAAALSREGSATATPVLVELFTSEGCSDCPPADELLARLDNEQFISGVHAIVLSEHVTYWNHLGWRDPFSLEQMDRRQSDYATRFGLNEVYTPQMVVDGSRQFVGNSGSALARTMAQAAADPKQPLEIADALRDKDTVHFAVKTAANPGQHLFAGLAQDVTHSEVSVGENAGRTLHHVAVVRTLKEFTAGFPDAQPLSISAATVLKGKDTGPVRLVAFLVDIKSGHVVGAAETVLKPQ